MAPRRLHLLLSLVLLAGCELAIVGGDDGEDPSTRESYGSPGSYLGSFWTTYYYLANQASYPGSGYPIYDQSCNVIVSSTSAFYKAAKMEGSAKLNNGSVINYWGSCSCGGSSRTCFKKLGSSSPWGYGVNASLIPLRSVAVDKSRISLGSTLYIKQWDGVQIPATDGIGGFVHDGCFRADDVGGAIKGSHYDFFAGTKAMWKALEQIHGTKTSFSVYRGGSKCAYVAGLTPGQGSGGNSGGSSSGSSGGGSSGGGNSGGSSGWGDCFYGGARGTCQSTDKPCNGSYKGSLCPGPNTIKCCMPPSNSGGSGGSGGSSSWGSCSYSGRTGTCQSTSLGCASGYVSGLCPGTSDIKCCVSWGSCSSGGKSGTCQSTSLGCASGYKSGLCPGPNSIKCCLH